MTKHVITEQEYNEVKLLAKKNKNKKIKKRLQVITMRYEGKKYREIAKKLGFTMSWVGQLCAEFKEQGLEEYASSKYGGNNQVIDTEKEREILDGFRKKAEEGHAVSIAEIKKAFDEYRTHKAGRGYIYMVLKRHDWYKPAAHAKNAASKKKTSVY